MIKFRLYSIRTACFVVTAGVVFLSVMGLCVIHANEASSSKVVMFYVDGLRPDTVDALVHEGKLPNIKKLFYDRGLRFRNFFSLFPSNTVISNGMLMTGQWPENTGLKTQAMFERYRVKKRGFFSKVLKRESYPRSFNLLTETDVAPRILKENRIRAIYDYLGWQYHSAIAPISPSVAPAAWPHIAANDVDHPYWVTSEAADKIDDINGHYAVDYMTTDKRGRMFMIWFPGLDENQHRDEWGQYGKMRDEIVKIDGWIGKVYENMVRNSEGYKIYTILFSDHGAIGGEDGVYNQPYHISRDFFYQKLKMNVRGADFSITHPGTDIESYAYIDNMGRGQIKLYLPVKGIDSKDWSRPNTFRELEQYGLGPNRTPVNLIDVLAKLNLDKRNAFPGKTDPHPIEFIILKISNDLIYIRKTDGSQAVIEITEENGKHLYKYIPVSQFSQSADGKVDYRETVEADPFDYLRSINGGAGFLKNYHDDQEWLMATYRTKYPDAVIATARPFHWKAELADAAASQDPDITLSAMPGWNFRIENVNGADHGYLSEGALRATLMISGPEIKTGAVEKPHRMVEVLPTIFKLLNYQGRTDFDEKPIAEIDEK